jgi:hypothetical protein
MPPAPAAPARSSSNAAVKKSDTQSRKFDGFQTSSLVEANSQGFEFRLSCFAHIRTTSDIMKTCVVRLLSILLIGFGFPIMLSGAPANDSFSTPTAFTGIPATVTSSNIAATLQINEPLPDAPGSSTAQSSQASVWFTWTAPITGAVQIDTLGSNFDTIVAVWTGSNLTTLSEIASNDEYGGSQSAVFIDVIMGVTYRIAIYGYFDDRGAITLNIANDITSRISGTITGPNGTTPLPGLYALAHRQVGEGPFAYWEALAYATTGVDGTYTIRGLESDTYRVEFSDFDGGDYQTEYYDNALDVDSAADIMVASTTTVTAINTSLALASKITGTVTGPDGNIRLEGMLVSAYRLNQTVSPSVWESVDFAVTLADGTYEFGGLASGTYRIGFSDENGGNYITEYFNNSANVTSATDILVSSASTVTGINASLALASRISGKATGPNGVTPLAGIVVSAYRYTNANSSSIFRWEPVASATTQVDGNYVIGSLTAGTYRIGFSDSGGNYATEFYNNSLAVDSATSVAVANSTTATDINASLVLTSKITGTVTGPNGITPLAGIVVSVYRYTFTNPSPLIQWEQIGSSTTQADGSYLLGALSAGAYRIGFSDLSRNHSPEFYNDSLTVNSATSIAVAESTTVTNINASLILTSKIAGNVTGPDGITPLAGIVVSVYQSTIPFGEVGSATTQADGSYLVGGLISGIYKVGFIDPAGIYIGEFYNNALDRGLGNSITVANSTTASAINASLVLPALPKITGLRKTGATSFEISFTATPGKSGQLQESTSLTEWNNVGGLFICQHGLNVRSISSSQPKVFWRVKIGP